MAVTFSTPGCRVFIVDDHPLIRDGLRALITGESHFIVVGEAEDVTGAFTQIDAIRPDLVVVDIALKNSNGLELVRRLHSHYPKILILVSSMYDDTMYAERALSAGARGYINKQNSGDEFLEALRQVRDGRVYLSEPMKNRVISRALSGNQPAHQPSVAALSDRELEVFRHIGLGKTTTEIARELGLSGKTVETHRLRIREKLGLADSAKLVREATQFVLENPVSASSTPSRG